MTDSPSLNENACSHACTSASFLREGSYLHQKVWLILRCEDCLRILDRVKASKVSSSWSDKKS